MYEHQHGKKMSLAAVAQMLSNTLYFRRFFPFYAYCVLGGLDEQGSCALCRCARAMPCHANDDDDALQARELSTRMTRSARTSVSSIAPRAPRPLCCSRCWTISWASRTSHWQSRSR